MAFRDAIDSHYVWVKERIKLLNPNRVIAGLLNAQDWPLKPFKNDAFYLLILGEESVGKQGFSPSTPIKLHSLQWVWINVGTDLKPGERKANRGDRYSVMQQMKGELLNGLYPGYSEKKSWAVNGTGIWTGTSLDPQEFITWTPVEFHEKWDKDSGVGYGSGAVRVQDMTDTIIS